MDAAVVRYKGKIPHGIKYMDIGGTALLGSVKVLLSKDDPRDYRDAGVKRTMATAIQ
jgi:hypothetical protein